MESQSNTNSESEYYIVSQELLNWIRAIAFNKCTMAETQPVVEELWDCPTVTQYLKLLEEKKPKIVVN